MGNTLPKLHQVNRITYNMDLSVTHGKTITSFDAYHKATEWFLHHMNGLVLFRRYTQSLDTLELNVLIAFSLLITIGEVCMLKFEMSLLGVNNVIEWEFPSPLDSSRFLHSLFRACSIAGHVIELENYHKPPGVMSTSWLWLSIFQSGSNLSQYWTSHHIEPTRLSYNRSEVGLGLVLSASLIKDLNSEENSKTYLIMLSLAITGLQGIILKLMALQKGWFKHAKRDFERFSPLRTKRIGT